VSLSGESRKRSITKALTYRGAIVCLDFLAIYLFTSKVQVALGFMIVSNLYTTVGYFVHERIWARIRWGVGAAAGGTETRSGQS
jgi:adenylylsulfate kinase